MSNFMTVTVINREISVDFFDTVEQARESMLKTYNDYVVDEDRDDSDFNTDNTTFAFITGNNNVDIEVHQIF